MTLAGHFGLQTKLYSPTPIQMDKQCSKIKAEDFPENAEIGKPKYKFVNHSCGKSEVTISQQRIIRLGIKNERRRKNGLPPLTDYAQA